VDDAAYPHPLLAPTGEASLCYQCRASQLIRRSESAVFCCDHAGIARMRQGDEFVNLLSCYRISDVAAVKQRAEAHAVKLVTLTKTVTPSRDPTSGVMAFNILPADRAQTALRGTAGTVITSRIRYDELHGVHCANLASRVAALSACRLVRSKPDVGTHMGA
jgi:hypothetical protein